MQLTVGETPGSENTKGVRSDPQIPDLRKQVMFSLGEAIYSDKSDEIRVLFNYINIYIILIYIEDEPVVAPLPAGPRPDPDRMERQQQARHRAEAA